MSGLAAVVPWIVLAAGLILAALAAALGVSSARRAKAQDELDRIFTLSPDLIAVADFEGHFTRVNPAVEQMLGYTQEEFVGTPYLDLVHPDDREKTAAEAAAIGEGKRDAVVREPLPPQGWFAPSARVDVHPGRRGRASCMAWRVT